MTKKPAPPRARTRAAPRASRRKAALPPPEDLQGEAESAAYATSPLGVLLAVAHDEALPLALRIQAAKAALPFVHRRMPSVRAADDASPEGAQEAALARLEAEDAAEEDARSRDALG